MDWFFTKSFTVWYSPTLRFGSFFIREWKTNSFPTYFVTAIYSRRLIHIFIFDFILRTNDGMRIFFSGDCENASPTRAPTKSPLNGNREDGKLCESSASNEHFSHSLANNFPELEIVLIFSHVRSRTLRFFKRIYVEQMIVRLQAELSFY